MKSIREEGGYIPVHRKEAGASCPREQPRMMGNKNDGKGLLAPIVVVARNILGKKAFNQLRGNGIALHSQVIGEFCESIGGRCEAETRIDQACKGEWRRIGIPGVMRMEGVSLGLGSDHFHRQL